MPRASKNRPGANKTPPPPLAMGTVEMEIPSSPAYLSLLRSTVEWYANKAGFGTRDRGRITLAVVEAVTNIIRHAYDGDESQRITLRLTQGENGMEIELLDRGKCVHPAQLKPRTSGELTPGGLGVRLMKTCMDHCHYEPRPGGGSRLVLRKLRCQGGVEPQA